MPRVHATPPGRRLARFYGRVSSHGPDATEKKETGPRALCGLADMTKVEPRLLLKDFLVLLMEWVKDGRDGVLQYDRSVPTYSHFFTHYRGHYALFMRYFIVYL